jgi:hypothetical protein
MKNTGAERIQRRVGNNSPLTVWGHPTDGDNLKPYIYNVPGGGFYQ